MLFNVILHPVDDAGCDDALVVHPAVVALNGPRVVPDPGCSVPSYQLLLGVRAEVEIEPVHARKKNKYT